MFVWAQTEDEANQICMDLATKYGFKRTFQIYRACTEEKHSFLLYDALENKFSRGSSLNWVSKIVSLFTRIIVMKRKTIISGRGACP